MSIEKKDRVLIVVNHLTSGETDYLYRFIEGAGRATAEATLGDDYVRLVKLYGGHATRADFLAALRAEGAKASVKRIDVLLMLHGEEGRVVFHDGSAKTSTLAGDISALSLRGKLRLMYSTCCFGDSHSADWLSAGFDTAIGSKKVNANSAVELAPLLSLWQFNFKVSECLAPTIPPTGPNDEVARIYGRAHNLGWKDKVDSSKVVRGDANLRISS
ncbi:hypothetical protein RQP53_09010 [Paucibacter sp. APW11]|uniref:CHAT domain-containing protein n=1 Tax=Roseateles aquae TaxID=3077235 RepID=A0ABU3PA46_9BURK|nr:hypothetical protein [Paucibacter sp. APW11]MDT8999403.1 hypothetical protein [Paucibacter sp. APW11]